MRNVSLLLLCSLRLSAQDTTWTTYGKNHSAWRYSELDQINTGNVKQLRPAWVFQTGIPGAFETTPLVFDRMMYITGPSNSAFALDALSGRPVWRYRRPVPEGLNLCCGEVNRGFATAGDRLFKVDIEAKLVALDRKSGRVLWEARIADHKEGFSTTVAPLVVKNRVIVGVAGAEFGVRGFIDAYDVTTGERIWRFYTVAGHDDPNSKTWGGDSWKNGGGSTWITGTYDPELNTIYWGTGNPGPDMNGDVRPGDNLYTCSLVALDADTGKLKWHFQFTPHDVHDWDSTQDPVLADVRTNGRTTKAVLFANRNGFFYALDRTNGKLLHAKPYTKVTWASGIGKDNRPILVPGQDPTEEGTKSCPGLGGGHNWQPTAYSPKTGLCYFTSTDGCHIYYKFDQDFVRGQWYQASTVGGVPSEPQKGSILAVNPATGDTKWRFELVSGPRAGVLATAGGLVFSGDHQGYVFALDANTGKPVWHFQAGGVVITAPISYMLDGRQYIAVAAGSAMYTFALPN